MADNTEIINVLFKLSNPQVVDTIKNLQNKTLTININTVDKDKIFASIESFKNRTININVSTGSALSSLTQLKEQYLKLANGIQTKPIKLKFSGNVEEDLRIIDRQIASHFKPELKQLGLISNRNPQLTNQQIDEGAVARAQVQRLLTEQRLQQAYGFDIPEGSQQVSLFGAKKLIRRGQKEDANIIARFQKDVEKSQRQQGRFDELLEDIKQNPLDYLFDKEKLINKKALKAGLSKDDASSLISQSKYAPPGLGAFKNLDAARELGFAGLFGGPGAALGGLVGGILGGTKAIAPTALFTQIGFETVGRVIENIKEALTKLEEAGLTFERSILGITGVLQQTTTVLGPGGEKLPLKQQLNIQQQRATEIQLQARSKLLPLGITGQNEATFVQGIVSALGQRGLIGSPDQISTIAERIGATIIAQQPQLLESPTRLLRDIQDVLGGGARGAQTTLGQILGPRVREQLTNARTVEEVERATQALGAYVKVARELPNAAVAEQRLRGVQENILTNAGAAYVRAEAPGLKVLAESLESSGVQDSLEGLATAAGAATGAVHSFGAFLLDFGRFFTIPGLIKEAGNLGKQQGKDILKFFNIPENPDLFETEINPEAKFQNLSRNLKLQGNEQESFLTSSPEFKQLQLNRLRGLGASNPGIRQDLGTLPFRLQIENQQASLNRQLGLLDTSTFAGREAAANATLGSLRSPGGQISNAVEAVRVSKNKFSQDYFGDVNPEQRAKSFGELQASLAQLGQVIKEQARAEKELTQVQLERVRASRDVRNAEEGLAEALFNVPLGLRDLNRQLESNSIAQEENQLQLKSLTNSRRDLFIAEKDLAIENKNLGLSFKELEFSQKEAALTLREFPLAFKDLERAVKENELALRDNARDVFKNQMALRENARSATELRFAFIALKNNALGNQKQNELSIFDLAAQIKESGRGIPGILDVSPEQRKEKEIDIKELQLQEAARKIGIQYTPSSSASSNLGTITQPGSEFFQTQGIDQQRAQDAVASNVAQRDEIVDAGKRVQLKFTEIVDTAEKLRIAFDKLTLQQEKFSQIDLERLKIQGENLVLAQEKLRAKSVDLEIQNAYLELQFQKVNLESQALQDNFIKINHEALVLPRVIRNAQEALKDTTENYKLLNQELPKLIKVLQEQLKSGQTGNNIDKDSLFSIISQAIADGLGRVLSGGR